VAFYHASAATTPVPAAPYIHQPAPAPHYHYVLAPVPAVPQYAPAAAGARFATAPAPAIPQYAPAVARLLVGAEEYGSFLTLVKGLSTALKDMKLKEGNYATWSRKVRDSLRIRELSHYIDQSYVPPVQPEARHTWMRRDGLLREAIVNMLDESQYAYVEDHLTALSVWVILRDIHVPLNET
jgi:hypothetical protein